MLFRSLPINLDSNLSERKLGNLKELGEFMKDNKFQIGQKIKEIRKKSRLTQEFFSEKIGIEPSSLSNIENGKSYPSMQTVLNIIETFSIRPEDFFDFDYFADETELETKILNIIKNQSSENKQIIYKIIKQFDV